MTDFSGRRSAKRSLYILLCLVLLFSILLRQHDAAVAEEKTPVKKEGRIQLNFVDVDITTVANFISKITGKNFIYDDRVTGKVTIVAPTRIDVEEAFDLFTSVLELKGYATVFTGTAYKIVPAGGIKQDPMKVVSNGFRVNDTYIARLVPLTFIQSQDVLPMIQPLISREGYVAAFGRGNSLLVIDSALNVDKILNILQLVDIEPRGYTPEVVYLKNGQAEAIAQTLRQIRPGSRQSMTKMTPQPPTVGEGVGPVADKRLNALILFGSPEENAEYRRLIDILDVAPPEASSRINVYYLENAEASEIAKVLEGIVKPAGPAAPPAGAPGGTPPIAEFAGRIAITPDKASNSLIIMASPEDYQNIIQVIKKLDRRPRQVFVEAMIAEVSIDKTLSLGVNWRAAATSHGKPIFIGGVGTIDATAIQNIVSGMTGFSLGGVANFLNVPVTRADGTTTTLNVPGFAALFNMAEFRDAVNVLSTPHILTSDNKEAQIMVGENVPFLSKFEASTTLGAPPVQSIERKDVGITLRIKPQISEGDYIKLDIYQEISALAPTSTTGVTATDIITTKRSAQTSVVVRDRQTVVIGGLIQNKETRNVTKVPFLGDIPLLGWLFKSTTTENTKTNVLVYLTPTIVKDFQNLEELKQRKQEEFEKNSLEIEKEKK
jgi:general secretion pathway protein D